MFFSLHKHTDDGVFDDFPKFSAHFPKISEDFPKLFRRSDERSRTFSKTYEDCQGLTLRLHKTSQKAILFRSLLRG